MKKVIALQTICDSPTDCIWQAWIKWLFWWEEKKHANYQTILELKIDYFTKTILNP